MSELRVRLTGEHAELGEVPARDVARLILEVERALARVASAIVGSPRGASGGRYKQSVGDAVRLRLVGIETGSVVPVLAMPDLEQPEGTLELDDDSLGAAALSSLLSTLESDGGGDPIAAEGLLEIADAVGVGTEYEAVDFLVSANGKPARRARLDGVKRRRLEERVAAAPPPVRSDSVVGRLYEANFESRTAKLRSPANQVVEVRFGAEHDDDIYAALRHEGQFYGDVVYDQKEHVVRSVYVHAVERGEQMVLGVDADEFWLTRSFDDLAAIQGTAAPVDLDELYDAEASDEEREAFVAGLSDLT